MKKLSIILVSFALFTAFTTIDTWKNDKPHSQLGFTITHLGISDVSGTFNDFDAMVTASKPDFSDASFELTANVASIDTRVEARNNHLKSPDFFDVAKFPTINFKSSNLKPAGKDKFILTGNLTIHGITKEVQLDLVYRGITENPMSKAKVVGFQITGAINRSDFNVGPNFPAPMLSDKVTIKADGEFAKP
ncbi:YceI family protein [Flavihumibacter fluvii]|uniref:YceI family protein n=1 Tax=Flavihumibacter fluvii TaxID=2838157 RepID=UPI001BDE7F34|nr:YceI family protein [Flavihumibacter fluvii]ULQ54032.1 YceI family protein [Flavihumibacter fluvii]